MCQDTTPASSAPWSSPTPEACGTFRRNIRIHHWFPLFHCYVSFSWFLPKGQLQTSKSSNHLRYRSLSGMDAVLVWTSHLWTVGIWYLRMGRMVNGKGQSIFVLNDCNSGSTLPASTRQHHHPENDAPLLHRVQPNQFHEETSASLQLLLLPRPSHLEHMNQRSTFGFHMRIKIPILARCLRCYSSFKTLRRKMLRLSSILNSSVAIVTSD